MNQVQQKERALLQCFVDVCGRLHIPYFLVCGSALGAVKYHGFIPWDDDVDVGLFRPDYERFLREAPPLLPERYFLQNYRTDPAFPQPFSKLRDSDTAFIETNKAHLPIHHGIYIDIFPLDGYPKKRSQQRRLEWRKHLLSWQWGCALAGKRTGVSRLHCALFRLLGCHRRTAKLLARYESVISAWPTEDAEVICNHGNWQGRLEYAPKSQYGQGTAAEFEGLSVRIPEEWDAYLTQKYGNWRSDLPQEQQKSHHACVVCDPHRSYLAYIEGEDKR